MSLTKKIIAVATTVTCALWAFCPNVSALTADELLAQIQTLQTQLNQLMSQYSTLTGTTAGTVPAACAGTTFSVNLTIGSTGAAVQCLQAFLNTNAATQVAATGAGSPGNESTYFGALTQAAVVKFQTNNAISPAAGFVGPITRAKLNELLAAGTTTPTTPTTPSGGAEGSISATANATPISGLTVYAGQAAVSIAGLTVKALGSDILVDRLDITFTQRPWLYVPNITITDGTNILATVPVTQANTIEVIAGSNYIVRVSNLNLRIPVNTVLNLVIKADITLPVGVTANTTINYLIAANALRGVDGAGLAQYAPASALTARTFVIGTATAALQITTDVDNPLPKAVVVNASQITSDIDMLKADVKALNNDAIISSVVVSLVDANKALGTLKLYDGSTLLAATSTTVGTASTTFTNLALRVNKDTTKVLTVKSDALATSTGGNAASVTLTATAAAVVAADAGTFATVSTFTGSTVTGSDTYFYTVAPSLALSSTSIAGITGAAASNSPQQAQGTITVNVTAQGGDIYVLKYNSAASSGLVASATGNVAAPTYTMTSNATAATNGWWIPSGQTKSFTLTGVMTSSGAAAFARLYLTKLIWSTTDALVLSAPTSWTWGLETFKTNDIFLQTKG